MTAVMVDAPAPTARPARPLRTALASRAKAFAWWMMPIGGFLLLWQVAVDAGFVDRALLPSPVAVGGALWELFRSGDIWPHLFASLKRGLVGFFLAATLCVPLGILIGWFKPVDRVFGPLIEVFRQLPSLAMFPVFLLFFGIGFKSQLAMVVWAASWPILLTTISGTRGVDVRLVKAALTLGAEPKDLFLRVALPAAVPSIATGLRLGGSFSFLVLVGAEMIGANQGIGYLVISSQYLFKIPQMYAALTILGIIGVVINYALVAAERRLSKWRQQ